MEDQALVAVTAIGNDRPGIVAAVTRVLFELGCNLEDATSTILRGHFSMTLVVRPPPGTDATAIESALERVADELHLVAAARPIPPGAPRGETASHVVSVYGADRPGIVFSVARALAEGGVNITELSSRVIGDDDTPVYALVLEVASSEGAQLEDLLARLRKDEVEVSIHPIEADLL